MKIAGSESGSVSISQRHGSADPDPHQYVMDPQHWFIVLLRSQIVILYVPLLLYFKKS
jgi:hypothetical protein